MASFHKIKKKKKMSFNIPLSTLPLKLTKNREVGEGDNTIVTPLGRSQ